MVADTRLLPFPCGCGDLLITHARPALKYIQTFSCILYVIYIEHVDMDKHKTYISVQLPPDIADAIKRKAKRDLISATAVVRQVLAEHFRKEVTQEAAR